MADSDSDENNSEECHSDSEPELQNEMGQKPRYWCEETVEEMLRDLDEPLPEPTALPKSKLQQATALIQWLCFFLVYWQLACHISDNGLEWLLSFIAKFLGVVNINVESLFLGEMLVLFPTTMYMVRKRIALDRDDFTKFVVCQKCKALYPFSACTKKNNRGQTVAVPCKNKVFGTVCGTQLVKEVVVKNGI